MVGVSMLKCPKCKDGKITLTVETYGTDEVETTQITCVHCFGKGEVTKEIFDKIKKADEMWCECDNPSKIVDYYEDGEHTELHKHHYRCRHCQGVVQIG